MGYLDPEDVKTSKFAEGGAARNGRLCRGRLTHAAGGRGSGVGRGQRLLGAEYPCRPTEAACMSIRLLVAPFAHDARGVLSTSVQVGARALPLLYSTAQ